MGVSQPQKMTGNPVLKRNPNWVVFFWFERAAVKLSHFFETTTLPGG